jgi:hypothetical protein
MGRIVSILLLLVLALTPTATSICRSGADPECCAVSPDGSRSTEAGVSVLSGRACDCCVTVEALPFDRSASNSRPLVATVAIAVLPPSAPLLPRARRSTEPMPGGGADDSRLSSIRTVVLLV